MSDSRAGYNYLLSACLAVTGADGMSVPEVTEQLGRSIDADGQPPAGRFIFTLTGDVRTQTRNPGFSTAVKALALAGHRAEVIGAAMPSGQREIAGLMVGTPKFNWASTASTLAPGAIAENLTSIGAVFGQQSQTTLLEFLRAGAALSSGTVTEPYALQFKFPHPMMHPAYTSGLTAIEAISGAVQAPYQLLIVGDPLCSPYKPAADMTVDAVMSDGGEVIIDVQFDAAAMSDPRRMEIYWDGRLRTIQPLPKLRPADGNRPKINVRLQNTDTGRHQVRVVLESDNLVATRHGRSVEVHGPIDAP